MASYRSPVARDFAAPPRRRPLDSHRQSDYYSQQQLQQQQQQQQKQQDLHLNTAFQQQQQYQSLPQRNPNRVSVRPPSSLYSQPSPVDTSFPAVVQQQHQPEQYQQHQKHRQFYQQTYQTYPGQTRYVRNDDGVSPPSSPELISRSRYRSHDLHEHSPDISPIDDTSPDFAMPGATTRSLLPTTPTQGSRPTSSSSRSKIPMMQRDRRQDQSSPAAATRTLRETRSREQLQSIQGRSNSITSSLRGYKGGEVRWDPRTGELTSSEKGRPGQVKPAEYARGLAKPGKSSPMEPAAAPAAAPATAMSGMASFANRLRRTMQSSTPAAATVENPDQHIDAVTGRTEAMGLGPNLGPPSPSQPSLSPAQYAQPTRLRQPKSPRTPAEVVSTTPTSLSLRDDPAAGAFTSDRPAWHGASGRTTLVAPVRDMPNVPPLNIPRKSSKRVPSMPNLTDRTDRTGATVSPASSPPPKDETRNRATVGRVGPPAQNATPSEDTISRPLPLSPLQGQQSQIKRKPTPLHKNLASFDASDPFNYNNKITPSSASSPFAPRPPVSDPEWSHPPSRFSVATYNSTSRESLHDFNSSDTPEMPPIPNSLWSTPSPPQSASMQYDGPTGENAEQPPQTPFFTSSPKALLRKAVDSGGVMDRRRPPRMGCPNPDAIKNGNEPIVISLKTPWTRGHNGSADNTSNSPDGSTRKHVSADTPQMVGSVHKVLPPAPPETAAKDRVDMLNARLANLAQRRININRSIKQMTELMPTDNLLAAPDVLLKREQEKHKVDGLRIELAEIQREEYEIGLKLHRAYKRFNQNADYEPTTLWVRRVTG